MSKPKISLNSDMREALEEAASGKGRKPGLVSGIHSFDKEWLREHGLIDDRYRITKAGRAEVARRRSATSQAAKRSAAKKRVSYVAIGGHVFKV